MFDKQSSSKKRPQINIDVINIDDDMPSNLPTSRYMLRDSSKHHMSKEQTHFSRRDTEINNRQLPRFSRIDATNMKRNSHLTEQNRRQRTNRYR